MTDGQRPQSPTRAPLRFIGLTGGIGSGKSAVARLLEARGIPVVDADQLAREAALPGTPALAEIRAAWPGVVAPDGTLDRRRLGEIVFADRAARARLEAILHPRIAALAAARAEALARAGHRLVFYEASLLVETGRYRELDGVVVVDAPEAARIARVVARDHLAADHVRARMAAQMPMADKRRVATAVLDNDGDLDRLREKVAALLRDPAITGVAG